jgi:selenide,water dikinase
MKRLVLLGGGHAHLAVLADLAKHPLADWDVLLVTPHRRQIYSGMLPGWVAGHYGIDECAIALDAMAARANVRFQRTACVGLNLESNEVQCLDGTRVAFDRLSVDTGPEPALSDLPGAGQHALPLRPIESFVVAWSGLVERILGRCRRFDLVVLGGGAAGVEMALAIHHRAMTDGWSHLRTTLVGAEERPLDGVAEGARLRVTKLLAQRGIRWFGKRRAACVEAGRIVFHDGETLDADACLVVTGAAAPDWPRTSGLATDARGFICVGRTLQSTSHPHVLAAGDVAAYEDARPKSGVFAVRAGPVLASNLRALCEGHAPQHWTPQQRALSLIGTGDHRAIAAWGPWVWSGAWVWRWKDRIDRSFVNRFGADGSPDHLKATHPQ